MSGVGLDSQALQLQRGGADALELPLRGGGAPRVGVGAGVDLHDRGAGAGSRLDGFGIGVEEQADGDSRFLEARAVVADPRAVALQIQSSLGRELLPLLGNQRGPLGLHAQRDSQHLVGERHLEVHHAPAKRAQPRDVLVLDVAAVLAKVDGDP